MDKRLWLTIVLIVLIVSIRYSGIGEILSLETLRAHRQTLMELVQQNLVLAALTYVGVYIGATALSVPGAVILTLTGGFLFGAIRGAALAVVGATLVFLLTGFLMKEKTLDRFGTQAAFLAEGIRRNAWSYLLVLRLVPLFPFFLVNLVPAFVGVRLPVYVLTTFFGIIPGTAVYSFAGARLGGIFDSGSDFSVSSVLTPQMIAALVGLTALVLVAIPIRNRFAPRK
jgi:uncharacterized membrane protein YdjX (TVP38/TMEM64 family)